MMVSIILPVYNECNRLETCVERLDRYLSGHFDAYEIIIVEDCSTDDSYAAAKRIAAGNRHVVLQHNGRRLGRGASLAAAIKAARSNYVAYMDADLATDLRHTQALIDGLAGGASLTTGSRLMRGSRAQRPVARRVASRAYNAVIRLLFRSRLHDHQCGFKGFNREDVIGLIGLVQDNHWFWDTELLILCQRHGLKVREFPVQWVHNGGNDLNVSKVKVLRDSAIMGRKLVALKWRLLFHGDDRPDDASSNDGEMLSGLELPGQR